MNQFVRTCALVAVGVLLPISAEAHFVLDAPPSWMTQDSQGFPEKLGPCGDEYDDDGGVPSGIVTAFQAGQTITVTIDEVVFHPGHYRVALAVNDRSELPAEPAVTPGTLACGSAAIEKTPVFPVLADDVLDHTTAFTTPQSFQVTLPSDVSCTNCTLQIIEFMGEHALNDPGGCFYHHCANISIGASAADAGVAPAPAIDGGSGATVVPEAGNVEVEADAAAGGTIPPSGGRGASSSSVARSTGGSSGCSTTTGDGSALFGLMTVAGLSFFRGRRRRGLRG
jgi:MYXO-CTERM domain-containing protein